METLLNQIECYWTKRAPSYTDVVERNLSNGWDNVWANRLTSFFPYCENGCQRILDVGTGPGFFAIILSRRGHKVTAVDYTEAMLNEAKQNAGSLKERIEFRKMDAQNLEFPDCSFDVVVSRNLTWNLEDPAKAYSEWLRVLRPGGKLINFDANWYHYLFDENAKQGFLNDHLNVVKLGVEDFETYEDGAKMEEISRKLPMSVIRRPHWDMLTLLDLGATTVYTDTKASDSLWSEEEKINNASKPGFIICAEK